MLVLLVSVASADPTVEEVLKATDDLMRGETSVAVVTIEVKTARYQRSITLKTWSRGTEDTLIRILEPEKDAGISTLKVGKDVWNYLPKVDRTMKVPAGMLASGWMGSHFTNDDLVRESRMSEDYTGRFVSTPESEAGSYVIELTPKPDAPVVWARVEAIITSDLLPAEIRFYDDRGNVARTVTYTEPRQLGGRTIPTVMTLVPGAHPDEFTRITWRELEFDVPLPDRTFTLDGLRP